MLFKSIRSVCCMALVLCSTDAYSNDRDEIRSAISLEERPYPRYHKRAFQNTTSTFLTSPAISTTSPTRKDEVFSSPVFTSTALSTLSIIVLPTTINLPDPGLLSSQIEHGVSISISHVPSSIHTTITSSIASVTPNMQISSVLNAASTSSPMPIPQQSSSNIDKATPTTISISITTFPSSNQISGSSSNSILDHVVSTIAASMTQNQLTSLASSAIQAISMSTAVLPSSTSVIKSQASQIISGIPTSETMASMNLATITTPSASQGIHTIASVVASAGLNSSSNIGPEATTDTTRFTDGIFPPSAPSNHSSWVAGSVTSVYVSTVTPGPDFASSIKQNASAVPGEQSTNALNRTVSSMNLVITANETQPATSAITPTPAWTNQTAMGNTSLIVAANTQSSDATSTTASHSNTLSTGSQSGNQATSVQPIRSAPSSSPSQTVAAAAPPPLTTPQTAGVAVAGTTGLLLAIVAAAYMIRRHQAKKARRASTGSAYPRIAFLYDPPNDGPDDSGELGSSETLKYPGTGSTPPGSKDGNNRDSNSWRYRFTDPGNPFGNHGTPLQKLDSAEVMAFPMPPAPIAVVPTTTSRGVEGPQNISPIVNDATIPKCDTPARTVSMMSPVESEAMSPSRQSILGEIASMAYNPRTSSHVASQYQPRSSSFGRIRSRSSPSLRQITVSRTSPKLSEQDLLIHVDSRTETIDSATLFPTASARTSISPPPRVAKNATALSLFPNVTQRSVDTTSMSAQVNRFTTESISTATDSRRFTDDAMSSQRLTTSTRPDTLMSSISSSSPRPIHRGWEEIRRYSDEKVVPPSLASSSLISLSPPPTSHNPPPFRLKKKSLVQLRRKSPASARARQEMISSSHLPLTVKIPFSHKQTSTFEIQNPRTMAKVDEAVSVANDSVKLANLPPPPPPPVVPLPEIPQPKPEVVLPIASEMEKKKITFDLAHASV